MFFIFLYPKISASSPVIFAISLFGAFFLGPAIQIFVWDILAVFYILGFIAS